MRKLTQNPAVRVSLAALVLLSGAVSPATAHAHPGGDEPHHHGPSEVSGHSHHISGHTHHALCPQEAARHGHLEPSVAHIHLCVWGFEVQLPMPDAPFEESGDVPLVDQAVLYRLVELPEAQPPQPTSGSVGCPSQGVADGTAVADEPSQGRQSAKRVLSQPLCDAARHERSGVQLI